MLRTEIQKQRSVKRDFPRLNSYGYFIIGMYIEIFIFQFIDNCLHLLCGKPPDHQEVFFNYSYTKFVFNFQFEKSLIKYVFSFSKKIIIVIIIIIIIPVRCSWQDRVFDRFVHLIYLEVMRIQSQKGIKRHELLNLKTGKASSAKALSSSATCNA